MSRSNIKINYIYNAFYQILLLITPLITAPYLSRVLQADGIGMVSYAESIVSYFTLMATMGISSYGQREISYVQDDKRQRSIVFWNTKILGFFTSGIMILAYLIYIVSCRKSLMLYLPLTLNIVSVFFDITWFFQGMEDFKKIVIRNTAIRISNIIFIFLFVKYKTDVFIYVIGTCVFSLLGQLSLWTYLPHYIERIPSRLLKPFKDIKTIWSLFLPTIAVQIYTVLDKTMIGLITESSFENGYYEQASKCVRMILMVVTAQGIVTAPKIGYFFEKGENCEIYRILYKSYHFAWFLCMPLCIGVYIAANNFVPWFYGSGYEKVTILMRVLSFLMLAIGINNILSTQYFIPTKQQNLLTKTLLIGAGTNFCLNLILIHYFQSIGAAIASVLAETVIAVVQLITVRKEISIKQVLKEGRHYYIAASIMGAFVLPVSKVLSPSMIHTVTIAIYGMLIYFLILFIMKDDFFLSNAKYIVKALFFKKND